MTSEALRIPFVARRPEQGFERSPAQRIQNMKSQASHLISCRSGRGHLSSAILDIAPLQSLIFDLMERHLYRSLLKVARTYDRNPLLKGLFLAEPTRAYDFITDQWVKISPPVAQPQPAYDAYFQKMMDMWMKEFLSGGMYYKPTVSLESIVKREFRRTKPLDENETLDFRRSLAFAVIRRLNEVKGFELSPMQRRFVKGFELSPMQRRFGFRHGSRLAAAQKSASTQTCSPLVKLVAPRKGRVAMNQLLLSSPGLPPDMPSGCFFRSVIWMTSSDRPRGLIVNQPLELRLKKLLQITYDHGAHRRARPKSPKSEKEEEDRFAVASSLLNNTALLDVLWDPTAEIILGHHSPERSDEGLTLADVEVFGNNRIFMGGPVVSVHSDQIASLALVHQFPNLPGAVKMGSGPCNLCIGGNVHAAAEMVRSGNATVDQFKFIFGHSEWSVAQLRGELSVNSWFVAETVEPEGLCELVMLTPETDRIFKDLEQSLRSAATRDQYQEPESGQSHPGLITQRWTAGPSPGFNFCSSQEIDMRSLTEPRDSLDSGVFFPNGRYGRYVWASLLGQFGGEYQGMAECEREYPHIGLSSEGYPEGNESTTISLQSSLLLTRTVGGRPDLPGCRSLRVRVSSIMIRPAFKVQVELELASALTSISHSHARFELSTTYDPENQYYVTRSTGRAALPVYGKLTSCTWTLTKNASAFTMFFKSDKN
eukprot:g79410.t1